MREKAFIHRRIFRPISAVLPRWLSNALRGFATAVLTPIVFSYRTGHFRSSLRMKAVDRRGEALPWYTYPSIDFLEGRTYTDKIVLEFGGGQSTLWWAARAKNVVTLEENRDWFEQLKKLVPSNVDLTHVAYDSDQHAAQASAVLARQPHGRYDVIVIDGLIRTVLVPLALSRLADGGMIICDNAEGYGFYEAFRNCGLDRVDFYGHAPGVLLPHATSIFFKPGAFAFSAHHPIRVIARE
jgi:hypothetical protein